jgi:hypothetical protein
MVSNYIKDITVAFELYESVRLENERLQQRIDELRNGSCRYNCRTMKEAWMDGWAAAVGWFSLEIGDEQDWSPPEREQLYRDWLKESRGDS